MTTLAEFTIAMLLILAIPCAIGFWLVHRMSRRFGRSAAVWRGRMIGLRGSFLPAGPQRDVATLRRTLQHELGCTQDMLAQAPDGQIFRADARAVLDELVAAGAELDADLRNIERFADPVQQRDALATVTPQVEQVITTCYTARQTILRTAVEDRDRNLSRLSAYVAQQADAATNYRRTRHETL
ncbi:MAG TPA: hypothetical protein VH395_16655 [Jatrophihabitantaceae bacterium]|jgi:hypothetical protein